jgi:hypothetical protein
LPDISELMAKFNGRAAATENQITEVESQLGKKLPKEYVDFLKVANGGEGFIGAYAYAIFWGVEELASMNNSYEVEESAPGFLIFGSDGGGEAFGFDTRLPGWPIAQLPFIVMDWKEARSMGDSFSLFLKRLSEIVG